MLSCWHDLLFLFCLLLFYLFSSFHGLVVWGWSLWTDRVSKDKALPALDSGLQNNNNNTIRNLQGDPKKCVNKAGWVL